MSVYVVRDDSAPPRTWLFGDSTDELLRFVHRAGTGNVFADPSWSGLFLCRDPGQALSHGAIEIRFAAWLELMVDRRKTIIEENGSERSGIRARRTV